MTTFRTWKYPGCLRPCRVAWTVAMALLLICTSAGARRACKQGVYIVGISSARQFEDGTAHMGWVIFVSQKKFYDSTAEFMRSDKGYRVDLDKDRGRSLFDMAMYAMNLGYKVDVIDNHPSYCDDFDELDIRRE